MTGEQTVSSRRGNAGRIQEYLLDSTVLIGYLRGLPKAISWIDGMLSQPMLVATTSVNLAEIEVEKRKPDAERTDKFLSKLYVYAITVKVGRSAGAWIREFKAKGATLHLPDCFIASVAYHYGLTLVTHNVKDFPMLQSDQLLKPW